MNRITVFKVDLFDGAFSEKLSFLPHLNLVSGENGTGKTNLLRQIKTQLNLASLDEPGKPINILAISPKRNSERKNLQTVINQFKQQNRGLDNFILERLGAQINDNTFENYPSLGDLFYLSFDKKMRGGKIPAPEYMNQVVEEFNKVVKSVFDNYEIVATWDSKNGIPDIKLKKNTNREIPLEFLSLGEQEVLSLVLNIFSSKDLVDVFLIDEPEVHLNWNLEERLFDFFKDFCVKNNKQMIVATHSRIIFKESFLKVTKFLYWEENKVKVTTNLSPDHKKKLAGEAIDIIRLRDFSKPTFFIEDEAQKRVLEEFSTQLGKEISVSIAGNCSNVRSIYKLSINDGGWLNAFFLEDGDNSENPYPNKPNFIHLDKYCIENYFLDSDIISSLYSKTPEEIKQTILDTIKTKKNLILKKNKHLDFLIDRLTITDITKERLSSFDGSIILDLIIEKMELKKDTFTKDFIHHCISNSILAKIFPANLVITFQS